MYKYVSLRKKTLGVDKLHMYDVYFPMIAGVDKKFLLRKLKPLYKRLLPLWAKNIFLY